MALQIEKIDIAERKAELEAKVERFRTLVKTAETADSEEPLRVFDEEWSQERSVLSVAFIGQEVVPILVEIVEAPM